MIPEFDDNGYLPPGIHPATLDEIEARFGQECELRQVQMESLRWLVEIGKRAGIKRLLINGSFTTDKFEPNDVDCVLLPVEDFPRDLSAEAELDKGLPFIDLHLVESSRFEKMLGLFSSDRNLTPKGIIEVIL